MAERRRNWRSTLFQQFVRVHIAIYRLSGGRLGAKIGAAPVLLLHHTGRRSGKERVSPLLYLPDGPDLVIVASKGGSHKHPMWWLNLRETPETSVEVRNEKRRVRVAQAGAEQKARLWPRLVDMYPSYQSYQERTKRDIPVIVLKDITAESGDG